MSDMDKAIFDSKKGLPNKLLQEDGTVTDLAGNRVISAVDSYENKPALPNKWLNPDGSYSTLSEIIGGAAGADLFIVVDELPATGEENKIYLISKESGDGFVEWIYADGEWDTIGEYDIDLSNYPTTEQMEQYVDDNIIPENFVWSIGQSSFAYGSVHTTTEDLNLWNNILDANEKNDIILFIKFSDMYVFNISKNLLSNKINTTVTVESLNHDTHSDSRSGTDTFGLYGQTGKLSINFDGEGTIISVKTEYITSTKHGGIHVLETNVNYSPVYEPLYPGSPATKKYVDDAIAAHITSELGGDF